MEPAGGFTLGCRLGAPLGGLAAGCRFDARLGTRLPRLGGSTRRIACGPSTNGPRPRARPVCDVSEVQTSTERSSALDDARPSNLPPSLTACAV